MPASLQLPVSHAPETFSVLLLARDKHFIFPLDAVVWPVGLLISPDVSLFIFNGLDSSKKRGTIGPQKKPQNRACS